MNNMERLSNIVDYMVDNRGKNPPYYTSEGIPVIDTFLIGEGKYPIAENATRYIDDNLYNNFIRCKNIKNDLLVTLVGNGYGNSCLCNDNQVIIQNAVGLRFKEHILQEYVYYYFKQNEVRKWIQNLDRGSAQPNVKVSDLKRMKLNIPSKEVQSKIVKVLKHYDDLIENNNNRIKILETMAEELYKEWFVRFRFPGYKETPFKYEKPISWIYGKKHKYDMIPSTWEYSEFQNIGEFVRGRNITASEMVEGEVPVISAGLEPSGYHNNYNVDGPSITISASGANAGYLSYHQENIWAADCSYYSNKKNLWFAYNTLKFLQPVITNLQVGSAQPHVYAKNINRLNVLIPDGNTISLFETKVKPIYEEIRILNIKTKKLIKQRDSLLPRLMSGKLSVEGKEII